TGAQDPVVRREKYRNARRDLDRAIAEAPTHQGAHFLRAFLIGRWCGDFKEFDDLPLAEEDIDLAIASGPPAADLFYHAVLVRAMNPTKSPQAETQIVDLVAKAVAHGYNPVAFTFGPFFKPLKDKPAFQAAMKTPVGPTTDHDVYWSNPALDPIE